MLVSESDTVQQIRIADVFVVGPLLLYSAAHGSLPDWLRVTLAVTGIATIAYNGLRYQEVNAMRQ